MKAYTLPFPLHFYSISSPISPIQEWASNAPAALNYHRSLNVLCTLKCSSLSRRAFIWKPPTHASKLSSN